VVASGARAFEALMPRLPDVARRSELFGGRDVRAQVKDGYLIGIGLEHNEVLPDGRLQITRTRTYRSVKHPETGKVYPLSEPWRMHTTLLLSPSLRLIETETRVEFHRSIDKALGYPFSKKFEALFAWDRARTVANRRGDKLTRTLTLGKRVVESDTYDYPNDAVPLEIVSTVLSLAVKNHVPSFDFELLLPGGATHGINARVHRTNDLKRYAKGYTVPLARVPQVGELAVIDMNLASPVKRVFFPHHFFLVYASADPADLVALWGGDPEKDLQAVRQ
jgi:hypothetical protein